MTYLISISIGPVQDFIKTARRSRDLWFGSWILSELSKAAAHKIVELFKPESLIFPNPKNRNDLEPVRFRKDGYFSVVNKVVAIVSDPVITAGVIEEVIRDTLLEIADDAFKHLEHDPYFCRETALKQIKDLPEFYWAAYPLANPSDNKEYARARAMTETMLKARKNTRNFNSVSWVNAVPKSSLDGQRETVIKEGAYKKKGYNSGYTMLELRQKFGLSSEGEQLCGVSLLKRLGQRGNDSSFFSTSHVAALPWLNQLQKVDNVENRLDDYITILKGLGLSESDLGIVPQHPDIDPNPFYSRHYNGRRRSYDGHLLFKGQFGRLLDSDDDKQKAQDALELFRRDVNPKEPFPYYAIIIADGDRMGSVIEHCNSKEQHRKLSRYLSNFAYAVRDIVEKDFHGWLVYAGGDDVLAFVPLHKLIECARTLSNKFKESFEKEFVDSNNHSPTLSMGIAITHHLEPLSDALSMVRRAEKEAKSVKGKNALAILLSKRSGTETMVKGQWEDVDRRLEFFTYLHRIDAIPDGAAYDLQTMARDLEQLPDAISLETKRILKRKRAKQGTEEISKNIIGEIDRYLRSKNYTAQDLAKELIVARELAKSTKEAAMKPEELPGAKFLHQEALQ